MGQSATRRYLYASDLVRHWKSLCFEPMTVQLQHFLQHQCGGWGGNRLWCKPTYEELAKLGGCSTSTISRLASGKVQRPSATTVDLLMALAGLCPYVEPHERDAEIQNRLRCARRLHRTGAGAESLLRGVLDDAKRRSQLPKLPTNCTASV